MSCRNYASEPQMGEAANIRNTIPDMSRADRNTLNQIIHSSDKYGPYASTPNPFRDLTASYDPKAQAALDDIKARYPK
eukprot:g8066.t1